MMKNSRRKWLLLLGVVALLALAFWYFAGSNDDRVRQYKAELRAKGEKISFAELGYPLVSTNVASAALLTNAVARLPIGKFDPSPFAEMRFVSPGQAEVAWLVRPAAGYGANAREWDEVIKSLAGAADEMAMLRAAVEHPTSCFLFDPASYRASGKIGPRFPFIPMRNAAQWLVADTIAALHTDDPRALQDLHALGQLMEFGRQDPTLVAQMIRVAISGIALGATWQTLQKPGWTDPQLAALQQDWQRVDLLAGLEAGILGERANGEAVFDEIRKHGAFRMLQQTGGSGGNNPFFKKISDYGVAMLWRMNAQEDELLLFHQYQQFLETIREARKSKPWSEVKVAQQNMLNEMTRLLGGNGGLGRYKYYFTSIIIPNYVKTLQTVVRNETQRRLTVVAIALKRYELRHGKAPAQLSDLRPEFLEVVPLDPMSARPFGYRLNPDGSFVLYSTGEDGKDDNGDPTPATTVKQNSFWSGRDVPWPVPAP